MSEDLLLVREILKILEKTVDDIQKLIKYLKSHETFEKAYRVSLSDKRKN